MLTRTLVTAVAAAALAAGAVVGAAAAAALTHDGSSMTHGRNLAIMHHDGIGNASDPSILHDN